MFEKITTDIEITQEVQKKQFRITTEDLRRFLATNGEDEELNEKLRIWKGVADNSEKYDEINKNKKIVSVFDIQEGEKEEDVDYELSKGEKTWKDGKTDENGVEFTYKVKKHIVAEPDERNDYLTENQSILKNKLEEIKNNVKDISLEEVDNIINSIKKPKIESLDNTFNNKTNISFITKLKNWFKF